MKRERVFIPKQIQERHSLTVKVERSLYSDVKTELLKIEIENKERLTLKDVVERGLRLFLEERKK